MGTMEEHTWSVRLKMKNNDITRMDMKKIIL